MRSVVLACLVGGFLGAAACLLQLDEGIACGDGYTDRSAGEQCDPADRRSFDGDACGGRAGGCDPDTCQLLCCGDGIRNNDEECDGEELGLLPPGGEPDVSNSCRMLTVPGTDVTYASGSARCNDECRFDRSDCSLCGNGQVDPSFTYPDGTVLPVEICDGNLFRLEELWSVCAPACGQPSTAQIGCSVTCNGCRLITVEADPACCLPPGVPMNTAALPCCCLLDPRGCEPQIIQPGEEPACAGFRTD